jgi:hypothetical protein
MGIHIIVLGQGIENFLQSDAHAILGPYSSIMRIMSRFSII